jgi:hypothetical protein
MTSAGRFREERIGCAVITHRDVGIVNGIGIVTGRARNVKVGLDPSDVTAPLRAR